MSSWSSPAPANHHAAIAVRFGWICNALIRVRQRRRDLRGRGLWERYQPRVPRILVSVWAESSPSAARSRRRNGQRLPGSAEDPLHEPDAHSLSLRGPQLRRCERARSWSSRSSRPACDELAERMQCPLPLRAIKPATGFARQTAADASRDRGASLRWQRSVAASDLPSNSNRQPPDSPSTALRFGHR
jgi:hypothetical protein